MADDFDSRRHRIIRAGVIIVMMRVDHVPNRLVGEFADRLHHLRVVAVVHVVDQDDAFVGDVGRDVAALALIR